MVNIAKLFWYQNAAKLLKYCQVSRDMWSRQFLGDAVKRGIRNNGIRNNGIAE